MNDKPKYNQVKAKNFSPQHHHRRSIRLKGYDYSQAGLYFITICCQDRECLFGEIVNGEMVLNDAGKIADEYLEDLPEKYYQTQLHEFIVMPNHMHAIIEFVGAIHESPNNGELPKNCELPKMINDTIKRAIHESPLPLRDQRRQMLLPKIVGWYKMNTAKQINIMRKMQGVPLWQRNYHEHIIRNEQSYQTISNYIINNPAKWSEDKFYSALNSPKKNANKTTNHPHRIA